mgnify:CR=1 FL=1
MNALLCRPCLATDAELDICNVPDLQEDFTTRPIQAIQSEQRVTDEEALHLSFEEAISDRSGALRISWNAAGSAFANTGPLRDTAIKQALSTLAAEDAELPQYTHTSLPGTGWQRSVTYVCIALMLMLIGFDLMGLLILRLH